VEARFPSAVSKINGKAMQDFLLYGAYGYTGQLIARMAVQEGLRPLLAGRNAARTKALAESLGCEYAVFPLEDTGKLDEALQRCQLVFHAAGPFEHTCQLMADACLRNRKTYLDITGELQVFEYFKTRDAEARAAGITLLPGTGFDVVPSDCLAAWLSQQLPNADQLTLALYSPGGKLSHGTALTVLENAAKGGMIRENGKLRKVPHAFHTQKFDFGFTERSGVTIPWGDLSTAFTSTGIPNIRVYNCLPPSSVKAMRIINYTGWLTRIGPIRSYMKRKIKERPAGPTEEHRQNARSYIWGEVIRGSESKRAYLDLPEGYTLTALASLAVIRLVLAGKAPVGYQTPATAFGPELVTGIPGVSRVVL